MGQSLPKIGPYSRPSAIAKIDGRRREARLMQGVVAELTAHVGGNPSATQRALIGRAAWLTLHMALMDNRAIEAPSGLSERDSRTYLAWSNTLARTLRQLGMKGEAQKPLTFRERLIAEKAAAS